MTDLSNRTAEKEDAVACITGALDAIAAGQREPDLWERVHLSEAIGGTFRGLYRLALAGGLKAMTPAEQRSPAASLPDDPLYDRFDLELLRRALDEARAEPVQPFGQFGPVTFARAGAR